MKDTLDCTACDRLAGFIAVWQMQVLFLIAGMSSAFALAKRSGGQYLLERVQRLLIPFLFGIATVVPAMTYITQLGQGKQLTFWQHYANFFRLSPDITGISGTFTPAHLWFILFLFLFSIIALPLFLVMRKQARQKILLAAAWLFTKPMGLLLPGLLVSAAGLTDLLGAQNPIYYIVVFISGYLLATDSRYQKAIARDWPWMLFLGVILEILRQTGWLYSGNYMLPPAVRGLALELNSWVWVLAILGMGQHYFKSGSRWLSYLAEAAYPFYILHLLVLTVVTYYAVRIPAGVPVKYAIIVTISFAVTFGLVEICRRIAPLRFLLGMKFRASKRPAARTGALARV